MLKSQPVSLGQIEDMNVIADTSPIRRIVIAPKYRNFRPSTGCRLQHQRNQVSFGVVTLAQQRIGMSAGCIEVTQTN